MGGDHVRDNYFTYEYSVTQSTVTSIKITVYIHGTVVSYWS